MRKPALEGRLAWALNFAVVLGTLATIPIIVLLDQGVDSAWLHAADWAIWGVFLLEYAIEFSLSPSPKAYVRRNWLSPVVLILSFPLLPDMLGTVRLARLARFLRFARLAGVTVRGLGELRQVLARRGLLYIAVTTTVLILAGAAALEVLEPKTVGGGFFNAIWWAIVTASTVGYGDIAPSTLWGRVIAVLLMLSGIGLISTFSATITSYFVGQQEATDIKELRDQMDRIERALAEIAAHPSGRLER
jgi:voltage-gated potassium channel